jgi:hypothetical protein
VILYCAGNVPREALLHAAGLRHRLLSFADVQASRAAFDFWIKNGPVLNARVFLDSGAYSAYTRKAAIDLDHYCKLRMCDSRLQLAVSRDPSVLAAAEAVQDIYQASYIAEILHALTQP